MAKHVISQPMRASRRQQVFIEHSPEATVISLVWLNPFAFEDNGAMRDDGRLLKTEERWSPLQRNQNTLGREMHCLRIEPTVDSVLS